MNQKIKKAIDATFKVIWWLVFVLLIILIVCIFTAKVNGKVPKVFGCSVVVITTNSMEDTFPVGTYILIKETLPQDVQEGDVIEYKITVTNKGIKNNKAKAKQLLNIFLGAFLSSGLCAILTNVITKLHIASIGPIICIKFNKFLNTVKIPASTTLLQLTKYIILSTFYTTRRITIICCLN